MKIDYAAPKRPWSVLAILAFTVSLLMWVLVVILFLIIDHMSIPQRHVWMDRIGLAFAVPSFLWIFFCLAVTFALGRQQKRGRGLARAGFWISAIWEGLFLLWVGVLYRGP